MSESEKVLFNTKNGIGIITLNSPKSLNSLDKDMCIEIYEQLKTWEEDKSVKVVILKSVEGKAFCAGGDVVSLYKSMTTGGDYHKDFFKFEYRLDLFIHQYTKPIVCFAHGIVMGGGIGIMNGCAYRIVTEATMMAMPEITIGLFPDVGGSFFLNKMPGKTGLFLGLTGSRFYGSDALYLSMADYYVESSQLEQIEKQILEFEFTEDPYKDLKEIFEHYSNECKNIIPESQIANNESLISKLMEGETIQEVNSTLLQYETEDKFFTRAIDTYKNGSPISAAVIFEQIKRGHGLSIEEVFEQEGRMALNFGESKDFPEGVRALLIDKDKKPNWEFKSVDQIESVDKYFS